MTISSTVTSVSYNGNGSTTAFPVTFVFFGTGTNSEIKVVEVVIATGAETEKINGTDYTVTGGSGSTGTVTATTAPAATVKWVIRRNTTQTQEADYVDNDDFPAASHEQALDRLTAIVQEHEADISRTAQLPEGYTGSFDPTLPTVAAGEFLKFSNDGLSISSSEIVALGSVVVSGDTPQPLGTASAGVSDEISRSDHVHQIPTLTDLGLSTATQAEMEAGTEAALRAMSPLRVAQAIAALETSATSATQAQQEAGTATDVFVTPANQKFHKSAAKSWAAINEVTTTTILSSWNVSSVVDGGIGNTTANYTNSFVDNNTIISLENGDLAVGSGLYSPVITNRTVSSTQFITRSSSGATLDNDYVAVLALGDLA